jgi:8-oxo-dGTP pyrophosphatase MutT (NUDIX family)
MLSAPAWPVYSVVPTLRAHVTRPTPELPPALESEVERLWQAARHETPALFNGRVFSVDRIMPDLLEGHWTEYRRITAQVRAPALREQLSLRPLAVCGLLHGPDGVVFGRRESRAVYQAGYWQLSPAGSVDSGAALPDGGVDLCRQILTELSEELGLDPADILSMTPLCLVEHPNSCVLDLGYALETALPAEAILRAHRLRGDGEYEALEIVPEAALAAHVASLGEALVWSAHPFLEQWRTRRQLSRASAAV